MRQVRATGSARTSNLKEAARQSGLHSFFGVICLERKGSEEEDTGTESNAGEFLGSDRSNSTERGLTISWSLVTYPRSGLGSCAILGGGGGKEWYGKITPKAVSKF